MSSTDYQLDIIRHGFSCGNLYHMRHPTGDGPQDPYLSDFGILQTIDLRKRLLERGVTYDRVLTSYLRRAIETALVLFAPRDLLLDRYPELVAVDFGNWSITPIITIIPYVSEIGAIYAENHGIGMEQLREEFRTFDKLLDFGILMQLDPDCSTEYDYDNFLKVIYLFPHHSNFALITHGNVMRTISTSIYTKVRVPRNTELWPVILSDDKLEIAGEQIRPARPLPASDKYDGRCLKQMGGKRHGTPKNSKRTRQSTKRSTGSHKRKTIRR